MKILLHHMPQRATQYWAYFKESKMLQGAIALVLAGIIFIQSGTWLRSIDQAAAAIDIGILSMLALAVLCLALLLGLTLITQEWLWPSLADFRKYHFVQHFNSISPWQQFKVYGISFCCLLLCSVIILLAIF